MFQALRHKKHLELIDEKNTKAVINLNHQGGRLQSLVFRDKNILLDLEHKPYEQSFAGSILFPFANRINGGKYEFQNKTYTLDCNEQGRNNSIHGLVYNKKFEIKSIKEKEDYAEAILGYEDQNPPEGFPYPYSIELIYKLSEKELSLKVGIKNTGQHAFPFTLGWHPYFYCDDFDKSFLSFNSDKIVLMNQDMIALGVNEKHIENPFSLKDKKLDDCFVLKGREIEFYTTQYKVEIQGHPKSNFFQIYTPPNENRIALEPMTGVSDSFNHKKGLHVLKSDEHQSETWTIKYLN